MVEVTQVFLQCVNHSRHDPKLQHHSSTEFQCGLFPFFKKHTSLVERATKCLATADS